MTEVGDVVDHDVVYDELVEFVLRHKSVSEEARAIHVDNSYIGHALNKRKKIGESILVALGYEKVVTVQYRKVKDGMSTH